MRKIVTTTFLTLDGIMQAPGGPEEDKSGGFSHGGWMFHYMDEIGGRIMDGFMHLPFELLLGRRTYDIFAAYWPNAAQDTSVAQPFNATRKYVVSHSPLKLAWNNSTLVTGDVVAEIKKLKQMPGPDLWVHGSGSLVQTLLQHGLIDLMHLWMIPVTVGGGKRLFAGGGQPQTAPTPGVGHNTASAAFPALETAAQAWRLVDTQVSTTGVIISTYEPAGELKTGTIGE